jgi:glycerol-3-phosphate O-acyltransferase / dihydroxyacetone phosphate acyltransferase
LLHTARRLYQDPTSTISTKEKQDLARRFSVGYTLIRNTEGVGPDKELPDDIKQLTKRLDEYQQTLDEWGLRDYQVRSLDDPFTTHLHTFIHGLMVWILASIPSLVLNAPVGVAAHYWAHKEAKKDLQNSRVKLHARDVLMSKKMLFSLVAVPVLWVSYSVLLYFFSPLSFEAVVLFFLGCPFFSYLGVMAVEAGMVDLKDLRPAFLRLLPSFRTEVTILSRIPLTSHPLRLLLTCPKNELHCKQKSEL